MISHPALRLRSSTVVSSALSLVRPALGGHARLQPQIPRNPLCHLAGSHASPFSTQQQRHLSGSDRSGHISGPHSSIEASDPKETFACSLFDRLWERYRDRVEYVRTYESIVLEQGATFFNDHIALRTLALQDSRTGIASISRLFEALGYRGAECYNFEDKHLSAIYLQHANPKLPKLFISELRTWELSEASYYFIRRTLASHNPDHVSDSLLRSLHALGSTPLSEGDYNALVHKATMCLEAPAWLPPDLEDVKKVHEESQYGAWVMVHGYNANHFTSLINSHQVKELDSIEKTVQALKDKHVPMKASIEGDVGTSLRQTATEAVDIDVAVTIGGAPATTQWPYAYFELAQRDAVNGMPRYEGFKSTQATHLFEMTKGKA